jgi:hypothetical protein
MYRTMDRRVKPRISCDYPAIVNGIDFEGNTYSDQGKLVNLSASGLFMLVNRDIEQGSKLSVTVNLCNSLMDTDVPKLTTNGIVVRTEPQKDGSCGVAIKFFQYRFL